MEQLSATRFKFAVASDWAEAELPYLVAKRWGGERQIEISPRITLRGAKLSVLADSIEYGNKDAKLATRVRPASRSGDLGEIENDVVFFKRPAVNKLEYDIAYSGLTAYYQGPLTDLYTPGWNDRFKANITVTETEVRSAGRVKPHVYRPHPYSYAFYHDTRQGVYNNRADADKYCAGKAFHLHSVLIDALGRRSYPRMSLVGNVLTLEFDPAWLDTATYPVVLDPTFGFTGIGGTGAGFANQINGSSYTCTEAGTLTSATAYSDDWAGRWKMACYNVGDLIEDTVERNSQAQVETWYTLNFQTGAAISAQAYNLEFWQNNADCFFFHDTLASGGRWRNQAYATGDGGFPASTTWTTDNNKWSIYVTYTATGGAVTVTPTTLALTLTKYAPTVTASDHKTVTPTTLALTTTGYAPTVTASDHQTATPSTLALTLTTYAPTVTATANQVVTPSTLALVLTTYAPTVTATGGQVVTPTTLALTLTPYAPTVTVSDNQAATPSTIALNITTYAPTVSVTTNQLLTPSTLGLTITTYIPVVTPSDHQTVTPDALALTVAAYAPTVTASDNKVVTPAALALILSTYVPTITIRLNLQIDDGSGVSLQDDSGAGVSLKTGTSYGGKFPYTFPFKFGRDDMRESSGSTDTRDMSGDVTLRGS